MTANRVFCAIDSADERRAEALAQAARAAGLGVKIGLEFFTAHGPAGVRRLVGDKTPLFLDLKLHDIPNTVAKATASAAALGPKLMTVHAAGGAAMLRAAVAAAAASPAKPSVVAVTVLSSLDDADVAAIGVSGGVAEQTLRLAALAQAAGCAGVVCPPSQIARLRAQFGRNFLLVAAGIRPAGAAAHDQKHVLTLAEAFHRGADYLVVGRPIAEAADPATAALAIAAEAAQANLSAVG